MKKSLIFLFILRMFFYFSVTALILVHPGISISFDSTGILLWFVIIPLEAVIGFLPEGKPFTSGLSINARNRFIYAVLSLLFLSVFGAGFSAEALKLFLAGFLSFALAFLLFHHPRWGKLSILEPFFLAWVCLRLLAFSRSGEEAAGESMALTQFILVWTAVIFLLHSVVVYFCLYRQSSAGAAKEGAFFSLAALAALLVVLVVLPPDFIRNAIIENINSDRMPEIIKDESEKGVPNYEGRRFGEGRQSGGSRGGELRNEGRRTIPRSEGGRRPSLRGLSEHEWNDGTGRTDSTGDPSRGGEGGSQNQYLVKIVISDREPVYMGNLFKGHLDSVEGFLESEEESFNRIVQQRFFVTWFNNEPDFDIGRRPQEVFSLSTLPQKYLPWKPVSIDPVILSENTGPLRYIHQVVSNTHFDDPLALVSVPSRPFSGFERSFLAHYLELALDENDVKDFSGWLNEALEYWNDNREELIRGSRYLRSIFSGMDGNLEPVNEYMESIFAIFIGFSRYQYNIYADSAYSIDSIKEFLFNTKDGACVEFSNSLALLGRLAGIPSRVVTGYLASEGLQTDAHIRGLASLREQIPFLQEFPFENLYMVTNIHSHSWTQFYIPDYGWVDFESTSFAIPPIGAGDFSLWDVVIPVLDKDRLFSNVRKFPWRALLRFAGILAGLAVVGAYTLRYGREAFLSFGVQKGGRKGARSLYLLLLAKLAADGRPIKPASKTALEYAELFPLDTPDKPAASHFKTFALIYSELRWREFTDKSEMNKRFLQLNDEYIEILKTTKRPGMLNGIIRIFSLRGLAYL